MVLSEEEEGDELREAGDGIWEFRDSKEAR
jgi:hypothetical protein